MSPSRSGHGAAVSRFFRCQGVNFGRFKSGPGPIRGQRGGSESPRRWARARGYEDTEINPHPPCRVDSMIFTQSRPAAQQHAAGAALLSGPARPALRTVAYMDLHWHSPATLLSPLSPATLLSPTPTGAALLRAPSRSAGSRRTPRAQGLLARLRGPRGAPLPPSSPVCERGPAVEPL